MSTFEEDTKGVSQVDRDAALKRQVKGSYWTEGGTIERKESVKKESANRGEPIAIETEHGYTLVYPDELEKEKAQVDVPKKDAYEGKTAVAPQDAPTEKSIDVEQGTATVSTSVARAPAVVQESIEERDRAAKEKAKAQESGAVPLDSAMRGVDVTPGADEPDSPRVSRARFEGRPGAHAVGGIRGEDDEETGTFVSDVDPVAAELVDREEEERERQELQMYRQRESEAVLAELVDQEQVGLRKILDLRQPGYRRQRLCLLGIVLLIAAVIAVAATLGSVLPDRGGVSVVPPPTPAATPAPTPPPTSELHGSLSEFLSTVAFDGGKALQTFGTPQYQAVEWLAGNANLEDYDDARKIQRFILAAFYYSMNGANWMNNSLWLDDGDECNRWFSTEMGTGLLGCTSDGAVETLDLRDNNLEGTIPPEVGLLSDSLVALRLKTNSIAGPIPEEVGALTKLTALDLWTNFLEGTIPSTVALLTRLTELFLLENQLSGSIPTEVGSLTKLTLLAIGWNQLTGTIPSTIGLLTMLEEVWLNANTLLEGEIPSEIGNLSFLQFLYLNTASLSGTIPSEVGLLTRLIDLAVYENTLSGSIPSDISNLTALEAMWIDKNTLSGFLPSEVGGLTNLKFLNVEENYLSGTIPTSLGALSVLEELWLDWNLFSGPIPSELGEMTALTALWLSRNYLSGSIPSEISELTGLTTLGLFVNELIGTIPTVVGLLTNLELVLSMFENALTGTIPSEVGQLLRLESLSFRDNFLTGTIPSEILEMTNLQSLKLYNNSLTGSFTCPDFIETCLVSCESEEDPACRVL